MDGKSKSKPNILWRIGGVILLLAGLLVLYAFLGGRVTEEQIERLRHNEKTIAEFRQKRTAEQIASHRPEIKTATKDTLTTMGLDRAAMQKRCDETFKSIFDTWNSTKHWGPVDDEKQKEIQKTYKVLLPKMRELIALYDAGVSVSDKAKIGYSTNENGLLIERLADFLMETDGIKWDKKQSPEEILKYLVPAAKFERAIDMPLAGSGVASHLQMLFDPDPAMLKELGIPGNAYQQVIQNFDPELLAPRRAWDWREQTPSILEYTHAWADDYATRMSTVKGTYDFISECNSDKSTPWIILHTALELPSRQNKVEYHLKIAEELTAHAENINVFQDFRKNTTDPSIINWIVGQEIASQEQSRLTCAGLEILRGKPIPAQVTPDSYFYDPYCGGRVKIEQTPIGNGNVRVKLSCSYDPNPQPWERPQFTFILPANHPALKNLK